MKKKRKVDEDRKHRFCDPGMCNRCHDEGNGAFWCDRHEKMVVIGWEATEDLLFCKRKARRNLDGK